MATIQERKAANGQTRFRALVRIKGSPTRTRTFQRKTDARRWAQQVEADLRRGRGLFDHLAEKHTLGDLFARYRPTLAERLSERELRRRILHLGWWEEKVGALLLAQLRPPLIIECREELRRGGGPGGEPIGPATMNRYLASLSAALTYGVEIEWIESNVMRRVRRDTEPRGRVRFLSEEEQKRLLDACAESIDPRLLLLVLIALHTGARQAEMLGLRWKDIDLESGWAIIHHTKNGDRRSIPLVGRALDALRDHGDIVGTSEEHYVFVGRRGSTSFNQQAWKTALVKAGIDDFRFHDLRHTAASYLAMSGRSLVEIAEFLGHKTLAMVKRYSHLTEQHKALIAEDMATRFLRS